MKMLKMYGMALFAVLMCVNFASCGGGDDNEPSYNAGNSTNNGNSENNGEGTVAKTKKLVKMNDDASYSHTFSYDNEGKLSSIKYKEYDYERVTIYTWDKNSIKYADENSEGIYTLKNGLITNLLEKEDGEDYKSWECSYNSSNQIVKIDEIYHDVNYSGETYTTTFTWDGDKLIKFQEGESISTYKYSGKTCKGWAPVTLGDRAWHYFENNEIIYAHPELIGFCGNQLPDEMERIEPDGTKTTVYYTYTFDKDGYVTERTQLEKWDNESSISTFPYVWE